MSAVIIPFPKSHMKPEHAAATQYVERERYAGGSTRTPTVTTPTTSNHEALLKLEIDPCKARGKFLDSMFDDPDIYFERKWDGDRRIGRIVNEVVTITGCRSKTTNSFPDKTEQVPHISHSWNVDAPIKKANTPSGWNAVPDMPRLEAVRILDGTILDGEFVLSPQYFQSILDSGMVGGALSKFNNSIMNSAPDKAIKRQLELGWMRWKVFDVLFFRGTDVRGLPWIERRALAEQAVQAWGNPFVTMTTATNTNKREYLDKILSEPFGEGVVAKHVRQRYGEVNLWAKKKLEIWADVIITGFEAAKELSKKSNGVISTTKYHDEGLIGKVTFAQYRDGVLWECGRASGMDEKTRREMTEHPENFVGKVALVKANGREPETGKFRHPQWQHVRDDKAPEDCVYDPNEC